MYNRINIKVSDNFIHYVFTDIILALVISINGKLISNLLFLYLTYFPFVNLILRYKLNKKKTRKLLVCLNNFTVRFR